MKQDEGPRVLFDDVGITADEGFAAAWKSELIGIAVTDHRGATSGWNRGYEIVAGAPSSADAGAWLERIHPDDRGELLRQGTATVRGGPEFEARYRIVRPHGDTRWVHAVTLPVVRDGRTKALIGAVFDITDDIENATTIVQERSAELEQLIHIIAHDLKSPLRAVSSFAQLLEHNHAGELSDEARGYVAEIVTGAARMHELLADLQSYLHTLRSDDDAEEVDLNAVVDECLGHVQQAASACGAAIDVANLPAVVGVPTLPACGVHEPVDQRPHLPQTGSEPPHLDQLEGGRRSPRDLPQRRRHRDSGTRARPHHATVRATPRHRGLPRHRHGPRHCASCATPPRHGPHDRRTAGRLGDHADVRAATASRPLVGLDRSTILE